MKKLIALFVAACLIAPVQANAATTKPTPKPTATKAKVVKKPATKKPVVKKPAPKKPVVRKKKNFPTKKPLKKWLIKVNV